MIPAKYRLKLNSQLVFNGRKLPFSSGVIILAPSPNLCWAVTISKKALPLATHRNLLRRQLNHHLYQHRHQLLPNQAFKIIINRPPLSSSKLIDELCSLLFTAI